MWLPDHVYISFLYCDLSNANALQEPVNVNKKEKETENGSKVCMPQFHGWF